jgi:uncharacterized coiled-coil DUF342 family protein
MEPINNTERRKAFTSFFTLFLTTIALVVALVFFSVQVPFKDNAKLRKAIAKLDKEKIQADQFSSKLQESIDLLDGVNQSDINVLQVSSDLQIRLNELSAIGDNDSTMFKTLYNNVRTCMFKLQDATVKLKNAGNADQNIQSLNNTIAQLQQQIFMLTQQNDQLRIELSRK